MVVIFEIILPLCTFGFWAWQPIGVEVLFRKLRDTGVVGGLSDDNSLRDFLHYHIAKPLNQPWILVIAALSVVAVVLFGSIPNWLGSKANPVWWSINVLYFWGINNVTFMIGGYVLCWGLIRQVVVIRALYMLFRKSEIRPKVMHPDGCMGLSAVGNYAFLLSVPIILWGWGWAMSLLLMPVTTGKEPTLFSTCLCIAVYPIIVSLFVIMPTFAPHRPMKKARDEALENVAIQIRERLNDTDSGPTPSTIDRINALEHKYTMIHQNYTTWPFRTRVLGHYSVVAVFPVLSQVIQVMVHTLKGSGN